MTDTSHNDLNKLNERLDSIISSRIMLDSASHSDEPLVRTAAKLLKTEHPRLSTAMRERIWIRVEEAIDSPAYLDTAPQKAKIKRMPRPSYQKWATRVAAIAAFVLFMGLIIPPVLSNAVPGDMIYPLKRGAENIEMALASDAAARVEIYLTHADHRLEEAQAILDINRFDTAILHEALSGIESAIRVANENNLFIEDPSLEVRVNITFKNYESAVALAQEENLLNDSELAALQSLENTVEGYLPALMIAPSNTTEVLATDIPPTEEHLLHEAVASEEASTTRYIDADGQVIVRDGAGTAYNVIAYLNPDTPVTVLHIAGDWAEIRLSDGTVGWIATFLLRDNP